MCRETLKCCFVFSSLAASVITRMIAGDSERELIIDVYNNDFFSFFFFLGDFFGKVLAVISLVPFAITAGFVALILFRRDLHTVSNI